MKISAQQAADILGVSRVQISRLVAQGDIRAERFGNALQIDLESVQRYQELRPERGRPLPAASVWPRLIGQELERPATLSGLRQLAIDYRRRARRHPARVMPARLERVLNDPLVVVSGVRAAVHHGAAIQDRPPYSIYLPASRADRFIRDNRIKLDVDDPNLIIRVAPDDAGVFAERWVSPLIAALDLVDDRDDRSAAEAIR